jgi:hypothetical protein
VRCFVPSGRIGVLESGHGAPDLPTLLVLAERLGVSVGELTDGSQAPVRRAGVRDLVTRQPGIAADELYAFEIALYLQSTGEIVSTHTGWHPVTETPGSTEGS